LAPAGVDPIVFLKVAADGVVKTPAARFFNECRKLRAIPKRHTLVLRLKNWNHRVDILEHPA